MAASYSQIIAHCNERVSPPALPAVDARALRLSQAVCDVRMTALAASVGVNLVHVDVIDAAHNLPEDTSSLRDPAVLSITFTASVLAAQQAQARVELDVELDLEQYPELRIALGARGAAPVERQHALTLGVAELLVEPLFVKLRALGLSNLRVAGLARDRIRRTSDTSLVSLTLSSDGGEEVAPPLSVHREHLISLPDASIDCLDAVLKQLPVELRLGTTPIAGSIVIGAKLLAVDTLSRLQPGDVLLRAVFPSLDARLLASSDRSQNDEESEQEEAADARTSEVAHNAVAAWGTPGLVRLCALARLGGASAMITKESYMSDRLESAFEDVGITLDQQADPVRISDLELPVQFEVDTLAIPLSQLSTIGPGYVIEFPVPMRDAKVRLVVHGNTIGHGELVTVGEHLGARIVRMAHNDNALAGTSDGSI